MAKRRLPIDVARIWGSISHLTTAEFGELMLLLMDAWQKDENPFLSRADMKRLLTDKEKCRRIIRYDLHPSNWPDGRWPTVREGVFLRDGYSCSYCGDKTGPFDIDHIKPKARGGCNAGKNLTVACFRCNRSKGARTPEEWRAAQ